MNVTMFRYLLTAGICAPIFCFAGGVSKNDAKQVAIKQFVHDADLCTHLSGEFDSDLSEAAKREIIASSNKYCLRAKRQLDALMARYKGDPKVQEVIAEHDDIKYVSPH